MRLLQGGRTIVCCRSSSACLRLLPGWSYMRQLGVANKAKQATGAFQAFLERGKSPNIKGRADLLVQFLSEAGAARREIRKELHIPDN